jgi:cell fate regulator YaaT (PSP1 superfamily)
MMFETRRFAKELGLVMKVSDVEVQKDNRKATFYYTADGRVDYRELIKQLGREFKVKVEMKQIGLRQEAGRIGGIGDCGRELCCSTWLTEFNAVPTVAAKYQNLFLNPLKLSGQCGRLKCCLNYELETYLEALEDFPSEDTVLETQKGQAKVMKIDILKRVLWFYFPDEGNNKTHELTVDSVKTIQAMNAKGEKPLDLEDFTVTRETSKAEEEIHAFQDAVGSDSITRFDEKRQKRHKGHSKGKQKRKATGDGKKQSAPKGQKGGNKPKGPNKPKGGNNKSGHD